MRILALSHLFPHAGERRYGIFVARQLQAMAEAGADITLLVARPNVPGWLRGGKPSSTDFTLVNYDGVKTHSIPYLSLPGKWFWRWAGLSVYRSVRSMAVELHQKSPFDVIYSTQIILGGDAGRRLARLLEIPSANLAIGTDVNVIAKQSASMKRHYRTILSELDGTLTCGQSLKNDIQKHRPHPPYLDTLCVYGVVDINYFAPGAESSDAIRKRLGLPLNKSVVVYVGYLRREKGLLELLEAFEQVWRQDSNVCLAICGSGVDESVIQRTAAESAARDSIHFFGSVEPEQVRDFMLSANLFVLPSYNEGMPNAVMEAMACGVPVVCTDVGGLKASLSSSAGAKLIPPRNAGQLATAITDVLTNNVLHAEMSRAARQTAEDQFDVRNSARRILGYLSSVVSDGKPDASSIDL